MAGMNDLKDEMDEEKLQLLDNVKKECKKLMEEAVTRKFIHVDSSSVTSLCSAVEACLLHRLKKRIGGLLPASDCSADLLHKITRLSPDAQSINILTNYLHHVQDTKNTFPSLNEKTGIELKSPEKKRLNGYTTTGFSKKYLWIRIALLEKVLTNIVKTLIANWREFYEIDALLADQVHGPSLVWLLDGPDSLDYSKMKTPDNSWSDPSAQELVQRHRIYSSPSLSHKSVTPHRRRLFTTSSAKLNSSIPGVPMQAREHVGSLHQNGESQLLFGKNNVKLTVTGSPSSVQGYLSLHKSIDSLLLKWTPNPMLHDDTISVQSEKSHFWNQAITVDLIDVVYLHCHSSGEQGGNVVLITQDGVQLPPLSFPSGNSLLSFLTCLEQGLGPDGRLDPPLFHKSSSSVTWPRLKKNILPDRLIHAFQSQDSKKGDSLGGTGPSQDFVFRLIFTSPTSGIDKSELRKLISTDNAAAATKLINSSVNSWKAKEIGAKSSLVPKMHTPRVRLSRSFSVPSKIALNLACEKMKYQIISRAFHGWVASYRHLKTVRTHLASLVLHDTPTNDDDLPDDVHQGLTHIIWKNMRAKGLSRNKELIKLYVYYGGIEPSIRKEVWPYLLDSYPFTSDTNHIKDLEKANRDNYNHILEECKGIERILQEKEKDLLALNGFANGEVFQHSDTESMKTCDTNENHSYANGNCGTATSSAYGDNLSRDISINSNISDPIPEYADRLHGQDSSLNETKDFSLIKSILETKDSLREMVESASERGSTAWKRLTTKKSSSDHHRTKAFLANAKKTETFDDLHSKFVPQAKSFDLELDCQTCGKKIIESRLGVLNGKLNDQSIEAVECFACLQERKCNERYEAEVSPYKIGCSPSSVVIDSNSRNGMSDYVVNINGEGTPIKRTSISSAGSLYSEDLLKDYALNIHRIDKDVLRCDRNHPYFMPEKNLGKLRNVIMCYVWEKLNIGYIQGMCDLCAPLLVIMDDEAKVFSCFMKLMDKMEANFPHGNQMNEHLANINSLIQILDPELHEILDTPDDNTIFFFCYRWFLLDFKRELQYEDIYLVWETIWAASSVATEQFNLFVALAMIELYREIIIDNRMDMTDIIKFFNEMAEQHDVKATLKLARNIVTKLQDIIHPSEPLIEQIPNIESMEIEE
ncbi:small G protein signaling modulator 2-like isoform X1 [Clytia hemisphaerica]|uniref:Uncharacterized protein n=1 Tax=Clytia hemisphaerica TaxID=252671 RepID=A0A7M5UF18_9CNID